MRIRILLALATIFGVSVFGAQTASAGLLPLTSTVEKEGENYRYTYGVILTTDLELKTGDYFTIYDFSGYIAGSASLQPDFTLAVGAGQTPTDTNPIDDPSINNLTLTYTGATKLVGQVGLGNFSFLSSIGETKESSFTSRTHRLDGIAEGSHTKTIVPVKDGDTPPVEETPEPGTLALLGLGIPVVGAVRVWRRRRETAAIA